MSLAITLIPGLIIIVAACCMYNLVLGQHFELQRLRGIIDALQHENEELREDLEDDDEDDADWWKKEVK